MSKTLQAFLITFDLHNEYKNVVVVAYNEEEARQIFIKWANKKSKDKDDIITTMVIQKTRKTKNNASMLTIDFYNKQNNYVENMK